MATLIKTIGVNVRLTLTSGKKRTINYKLDAVDKELF